MSAGQERGGRARASQRRWKLSLALMLSIVFIWLTPNVASSWWANSVNSPSVTLTATRPAAPQSLTCTTVVAGALGLSRAAQLNWAAVPNATSYRIYVRNTAVVGPSTVSALVTTVNPATVGAAPPTTVAIQAALLNGVLGSLVDLLLGGGVVYLTVEATFSNGWTSSMSAPVTVGRYGALVGALLGGVECRV
ncbi:hypothetical protein [Humidisolicoccus flavus]|uniref:hypothetical protein n=1 Tax=Humidisolicoccus flavus TaxID=3111414 RepID=UPI003248E8C9